MQTVSSQSLSFGLLSATVLAALLLVPTASQAQYDNTATGTNALSWITTGSYNTAEGYYALYGNTSGNYNTANGSEALLHNSTGNSNTAEGYFALYGNTSGNYNTANGYDALNSNSTGWYNTANGMDALLSNYTGYYNTATGVYALLNNYNGNYNTATGVDALENNLSGYGNTAEGYQALYNATGSYNIALGYGAGFNVTGNNNIDIGNQGVAGDNGVVRIGTSGNQTQTFISGISGVTASGGVAVYINANGQLGTLTSSRRFKYDITDMGAKSDKLMDLRPVMFRYKEAAEDGTHPVQYGLIAEEVAQVYPDLVQYDKQGKPFTVYYHLLTPMMLNELQKAHQQLAIQQTEISSLKAAMQNRNSTLQNQSAVSQTRNSAMQNQVASLQYTVQLLLMVFTALVLIVLVGAGYVVSARTRRFPSRPFVRARQIENCAS